jgi:cobalt-zinc-cadmium efflux system protein
LGFAHAHEHGPEEHAASVSSIRLAFFLNLGFALLEMVGGVWTNSIAIVSDALHDVGDSFTLGLSWYLEHHARRGRDERYSYGYRRFSLLGALINTVILIAGSILVLSEALPRLLQPQPSNARGMVVFAVVGIMVNGVAALRLRRGGSFSARIVAWHLLEDVLGWLAVLVVSIVLLFRDIRILDPLLSVLITLYVLVNVIGNLRKTLALFLQAVPENVDVARVLERLASIPRVRSTHDTHIWSLDGTRHVLTTHLVVQAGTTAEEAAAVKCHAREALEDLDFVHSTIEIEYEGEDCELRQS